MTPRDWDHLTVAEADELLDWLEDYLEAMAQARQS